MKTLIKVIKYSLMALLVGGVTTVHAANLDFELINKTGWGIKAVYVAPSGQDDWEENILKGKLKDGETLEVTFSGKEETEKWDLKIVWVDGGEAVYWRKLDLSKISKLSLYYDADKDVTSAKSE
jgi:hypothetical protein